MAAGTISDYASSVLKTIYSSEAIENSTLDKSPLLGMLPKDENFAGYDFKELVFYGDLKGAGNVFSTTQSAINNPNDAVFSLTRKETYAMAALEGWLIEAAKAGDKAAFVSALKRHMDSALHAIGQTMSHQLYRNSYGARGTIGTISGTTVTLNNVDDIVLFEVGMPLVSSLTDGAALSTAIACTVATINRDAGSFTTSVDMSGQGWTTDDYIYRSTDTDATTAAVSSGLCISGLRDWMPATPTATAFFGQNRALDWSRLAGLRYDGSGLSHRETFNNASARADRDNCRFDHLYLPTSNFAKLANELGTNVRYVQSQAMGAKGPSATVGFEGISMMGPGGRPVKVFADRWCPPGLGFGLRNESWKIRSLNKAPHILNLDGLTMMRSATANTYEIRWGVSWQLGCRNPGDNMVITLPS